MKREEHNKIILNDNINESHLHCDALHLNVKGTIVLAENYINAVCYNDINDNKYLNYINDNKKFWTTVKPFFCNKIKSVENVTLDEMVNW